MSKPLRRPIEADELPHLRALGDSFRALRRQTGLSCRRLGQVAVTPKTRQIERIEQGTRRTTRSALDRLVGAMLLACPDLGEREQLVAQLVQVAGPALAPESPYADKSMARRDGKVQRVADRRAMYRHLWD